MRESPDIAAFAYSDLLPLGPDTTDYRLVSTEGVSTIDAAGRTFLKVEPEALTLLTSVAMHDINHYLRAGHLQQLRNILEDPEASDNDRFVATELLQNANIAAGGVLPMCQDTGTAVIMGRKGEQVLTFGDDARCHLAGRLRHLPHLQPALLAARAARHVHRGQHRQNNLPAQIEIHSKPGDVYELFYMAKGRRLGQQVFPVPEDQGPAQRGVAARLLR